MSYFVRMCQKTQKALNIELIMIKKTNVILSGIKL